MEPAPARRQLRVTRALVGASLSAPTLALGYGAVPRGQFLLAVAVVAVFFMTYWMFARFGPAALRSALRSCGKCAIPLRHPWGNPAVSEWVDPCTGHFRYAAGRPAVPDGWSVDERGNERWK
jgi:hypothetical protein